MARKLFQLQAFGCIRPLYKSAATALMSALLLSACSAAAPAGGTASGQSSGPALKEMGKDEKATIKVMYHDKNFFFQEYGNMFSAKFPNIDVEVVSMQGMYGEGKDYKKEYQKLFDTEKPDVIFVQDLNQLEKLGAEGRLLALDDVIKQDKFDIDQIHPPVIELLKAHGDGKLYGLTPEYYSNVIYYNKDLFEKYGVPLPTNKMSWEDLLQTAKRFPTDGKPEERVYGFAAYNYGGKEVGYMYLSSMAATLGLRSVDPERMSVTMETDGWKRALQTTVDALKSGAVYVPQEEAPMNQPRSYEDYLKSNPFIAGRAAMTMDGSYLMQNLERAKEVIKDMKPVNWDVVTMPVDPNNPDVSNELSLNGIFAVNAQASNLRAAWELVKYINSDEMARVRSKSTESLLTRKAYMKERDGHSLEPFYMLKPASASYYKDFEKVPVGFFMAFRPIMNTEIQAIVDGKKTVDEALKSMQEQGQAALTKAKTDQAAAEEKENSAAAK
ncbi:ABC transporter substrate-binding protein [Paenibacillus chartarius]|uniref:ABC transporter substrate-binding protein n=1 Tax=Paenibacillus chartarius TaxID=747481 RepID=A0ABV6DLS5_9BACL